MKVVTDIDDNLYTRLFNNGDIDAVDMLKACVAIRKGIPLPKGHGRLIDADKTLKNAEEEIYNASNIKDIINPAQMYAIREILTNAPTIIEADKAESEEMNDKWI